MSESSSRPPVDPGGGARASGGRPGRLRRALSILGIGLLVILLGLGLALAAAHQPRPEGVEGAEAEALARRIEEAVSVEGWERTGAVRWTFAGRTEHLWDRRREVARVRRGSTDALIFVGGARGRAYRDGVEVFGDDARELLESANAAWINDSFWLNPLAKMRDEGVHRALVSTDEGDALLVSYSSGGLTPGDAYLWLVGPDGLPREWRLWVSIVPIGGIATSWEGWQTLPTGARIATRHRGPLGYTLELTDVEGAETLEALVGSEDPFEPLFARGTTE